jgi:hypothetical protein
MADNHADVPPTDPAPPGGSANTGGAPAQPNLTPEVLKSAYNAFKKRWKLTRLDQESRIGRGPMSSGQKSAIAGIVPPDQFPRAVWEELVKQGRLKYTGSGFYAMPDRL